MKLTLLGIAYAVVLVGSWELQKHDLLLGYTLGVFGLLGAVIWFVDYFGFGG
jgi:hypothetical protein